MPASSARVLQLLSLIAARDRWTAAELAARLDVSERTVRRDVETLRSLGYDVRSERGTAGGYRFGARDGVVPLVLDEDQAVAVAVALQSAPVAIAGLEEAAAQALLALRQDLPEGLRAEADALALTRIPNLWEFPAPPIDGATLRAVGSAVRRREVLRFRDAGGTTTRRIEPHDLVLWAGRWYVAAYDLDEERWTVRRVDGIEPLDPTRRSFAERERPDPDLARFVSTTVERGDTPAAWPCTGSAVLALPASLVARYAPGGSVTEHVGERAARLRLGAWSWSGIAGILLTFDCALTAVEPAELRAAFARIAGVAADGARSVSRRAVR